MDYLVIAGTTLEAIMKLNQQITAKYECKDLGELDGIFNMKVTRTVEGGLFLSQSLYVMDVLEKFKQYLPAKGSKFNGAETLMNNKIRLHKKRDIQLRFEQKVSHTARWLDHYCGLPMDRDRTYRSLSFRWPSISVTLVPLTGMLM